MLVTNRTNVMAYSEWVWDQDQDKLACMVLCGSFHTATAALPVLWHCIGPGPGPVPGPVEVLYD